MRMRIIFNIKIQVGTSMRHLSLYVLIVVVLLTTSAHAAETTTQSQEPVTLEPITITATKREQRVRDISTSISSLSDVDLDNIKAETLEDVAKLFPNVHMKSTSSGSEIVIRGFSTWDTALQSPAGLYVDGVPYPLSFMQNMYLHDVERIEVLRGPQGSLYGKNSESGVINIVRRIPDNTARASALVEAGNYDTFHFGASAATPLLEDKLYFSGSFLRHQTDGYVKNTYKGSDRAARHEVSSGRGMLRFTPSDIVDVRLSLDVTHSDDGRGTMRFSTGPNRSNRFRVRSNAEDKASSDFIVPSLAFDITGDAVKFSSISSYMNYSYKMKSDLDRTPLPIGVSDMKIDQESFTQELRLASVGQQKLSWVAGAFLSKMSMDTDMDRLRRMQAATTYLHTKYTEETGAVFGQATWSILDTLRLTAGLRAEHTRLDGEQTFKTGAGLRRKYSKSPDFTEFLPMASLSLDATDNLTTYITWSQGYLPGGFNVFSASNRDNFYYKPEYSTNYELGLKTNWLNNKLLANAAVFHSRISDKQVREEDPSGGPGTWKFTNSAKAESSGVELELKAYPVTELELRGGIGYARSKITDWTVTTPGGGKRDYSGKRLPWAPDLTYNVGVGYTHESGFFAQADVFGSGKQYFDTENTLSDSGHTTLNLQVGYRGDNWEISIWGKNLLDDHYAVKKLRSGGETIVEDGAPMTFGTNLVWRF
ncbi:TPA: TonB-dependent receptor [Aeromonas dhakensis]|nr:TonB-dependent receptor [Aeromonas dhakensis]HDX8469478.1 TonB-dependent receptor [Aeromonas dhakensis]HDZ8868614.1 TonB-dependent receptor [Aeromonas dhakensis]HDZ8931772.1 TonB-dependent receptor [Aeromonas dhakensis]HEA3210070.1 TonB-dependent receptor [Aeromonas dhakensis]